MRALWLRISAVCVLVLGVSLAVACALTYQLLLHAGRSSLDSALHREDARLQAMVVAAKQRPGARPRDVASRAVRQYLTLFPDTEKYLTVSRIGSQVLTAPNEGPAALEQLLAANALPSGPPDRIVTIATDRGDVRTLSSPIVVGGERVGTFQVAGSLAPVRHAATAAMSRLGAAAAVSLLLGAALMVGTIRTGLRPMRGLSGAMRATDFDDLTARVPHATRRDELGDLAREFNRMLERLEAAAAARRDLLAMVSHELRTPITICLGHVEMLQRLGERDSTTLLGATALVREEMSRMRLMVEDLMALARSESGEFLSPRRVTLADLFDDIALRLAGLQLGDVSVRRPGPGTFDLDPERVAQAVLNLVVNARTHTPPGTAVTVSATYLRDAVEISVSDRGQGIDPDILADAFDPFVRGADAARGGHGLGLAVVRAVAEPRLALAGQHLVQVLPELGQRRAGGRLDAEVQQVRTELRTHQELGGQVTRDLAAEVQRRLRGRHPVVLHPDAHGQRERAVVVLGPQRRGGPADRVSQVIHHPASQGIGIHAGAAVARQQVGHRRTLAPTRARRVNSPPMIHAVKKLLSPMSRNPRR